MAPGSSFLMLYMLLNYYEIYFSLAIVRSVIISISDELSCWASQWQLVVNNAIKGRKYKGSVMKTYKLQRTTFLFLKSQLLSRFLFIFFSQGEMEKCTKSKSEIKMQRPTHNFLKLHSLNCFSITIFNLNSSSYILCGYLYGAPAFDLNFET